MRPYDFVHLALLALNGEIQGKTKLQKTMYFLGVLTSNLDSLGYRAHYYGPYSDDIAHAVDSLKSLNFLSQTSINTGLHNAKGFEISRQDFRLTDEGKEIAKEKSEKYPEDWQRITEAVSLLRQAGDIDYMKMSVAAKTHFLRSKDRAATVDELCERAKQVGWNPSPEEVKESFEFLKKLGLAR